MLLESTVWDGRIKIESWRNGGGSPRPVTAPATGATLGTLGMASAEDVAEAAHVAAEAQSAWAATRPEARARVLRRAGDLLEENATEIKQWIVREGGGVQAKAALEVHISAQECYEAAALPTHPAGEVLASNDERWSFARRRPAGVVGVIAPFNFPLILSLRAVAPALALGNAVLLKPDPRTGVCGGVTVARIFEEAGLPPGLLTMLPGGSNVGEAVVTDPTVRVVAFTGSTAAGRAVAELAGRHLKRVHLELGGKNALIVLPGADVDAAASAAAFGAYLHQGQICMATGRIIVHESIHDEFVDALVQRAEKLPIGNPDEEPVAIGPIIDEVQLNRVEDAIKQAVDAGARLATGGTHEGLLYRPTVLTDVGPTNPAWRREIFGPVAPVTSFTTLTEAVELANDTEYGLSIGILGDVADAIRLADQFESGKVHINEQTISDEANAPFGGMRASGNGARAGGAAANIESYTEVQWLTVRPTIAPYPF